jgi:O-antigen/teichoic acid export membrane protein
MSKWKAKIFNISHIGIADFASKGIGVIFWLYMASVLGPEKYGNVAYLLSFATLASGISLFGSNYTLMVYSAKKIKIQSTLYFISLILTSISSVIIFFFVLNLGISFIILAYVALGLVTSDLLGKKIYGTYSKFLVTQKILLLVLGIGLYYVFGEIGIFIGIVLSHIHFIIIVFKNLKESKIDFKLFKEKKKFIFNNFAVSVSGTVFSSLDKIIILPLLGASILGNYSLGLQFFSIILLIPLIFQKYLIPQQSTGIENKKLKKLVVLFSIILAIVGSILGPIVMSTVFPKFTEVEDIIQIISWAVIPITIRSAFYMPKFWAKEMNRELIIISLTLVIVQIIGILTLGPIFGEKGIAYAFVISTTFSAIMAMIMNKLYEMKQT